MIHRNNYEEFFLMYVDDELTSQQRAAVELFVMENPDLAAEFHLLQQTKLPADESLVFAGKEHLLKTGAGINMGNYEEYFLLYIDNELDEKRRKETELFVLQHPQLQEAFTLLKQTVLEKETVAFENKDLLYRHERRVIPLIWKRMAVAAALLLLAVAIWMLVPKGNNTNSTVANEETKSGDIKKNNESIAPPLADNTIQQNNSNNTDSLKVPQLNTQKIITAAVEKKQQPQQQSNALNTANTQQPAAPEQTQDNNTIAQSNETPVEENKTAVADNSNSMPDEHTQQTVTNNTAPIQTNTAAAAFNDNTGNNIVQPAVYKVLNTDDDVNRNSFYIGSMALNKNKVRGFMKKVGGLFASKTKNTDDKEGKLQVANLEFKTN